MSRASSTPEMISTRQHAAARTHCTNAWEWRASRNALVAPTRTLSVTICCVARWNRRRTCIVSAMESGVRNPDPKTPSPKRVTPRASWRARRRPPWSRAILSRTELEPISTAANVGMVKAHSLHARGQFVTAGGSSLGGVCGEPGYAADSIRSTSVGLFVLTLRDSAEIGTGFTTGWIVGEAGIGATAYRNLLPVRLWSTATSED